MKKFGIVVTTAALAILATTAVASAQMGVAVMWEQGGVVPVFALPITVGDGMVIQPVAAFEWVADDGPNPGSAFLLGLGIEKHMMEGDTRPLIGAQVAVSINSPKVGDSYTNFGVGVFLGGTAKLADNVSLVGQWGPAITIVGEKGSPSGKSYATVSSQASITLRWWVFGN